MKLSLVAAVRLAVPLLLAGIAGITAPAQATIAIPAQFSVPLSNPLDQLLNTLLGNAQQFTTLAQQDLTAMLGDQQTEVRSAIQTAFGPLGLDSSQTKQNILQAIERESVAVDGVNTVLKHQGTTQNALTKVVEAQYLSREAQQTSADLVRKTQQAIEQIKQCAETANAAPSTQDVLKSLTCQYVHLGTLEGIEVAQNDAANRINATLVRAVNDLNQQMVGTAVSELRDQQAETLALRQAYVFNGFVRTAPHTATLQLENSSLQPAHVQP